MAASLAGCTSRSSGPPVKTVRIALPRDAITWLPVHLAQALGTTARKVSHSRSPTARCFQQGNGRPLGGSVDVAASTSMLIVQLAAEGRDVRGFITFYTFPNYALVVAPAAASTIQAVADLKGRRVGVTSPGSPTQLLMNYSLVSHGLSPADVSTVTISTGAASLAAISNGARSTRRRSSEALSRSWSNGTLASRSWPTRARPRARRQPSDRRLFRADC